MLRRDYRFHGYGSLNWVYKTGKTVRDSKVSLRYGFNNRRQKYRAAVVVSRKVSKSAVVRNRIRRRIYEIIRVLASDNIASYDLIFIVYDKQLAELEGSELKEVILGLLRQAKIINDISQKTNNSGIVVPSKGSKT